MENAPALLVSSKWAYINTTWDYRAELAAEWLREKQSVADIGCGLMTLKALLPSTTKYIPVDIASRSPDTIIVDLNKELLPSLGVQSAAVLGVIEYIVDPSSLLSQLRQFRTICISYNHKSINDLIWKLFPHKKKVGWKHRLTKGEFERLMLSSGYEILFSRRVRIGERIYLIETV